MGTIEKFLLCRPQGGLNDNLTQIAACINYCNLFKRSLIIDTNRSGGFAMPFSMFFSPFSIDVKTEFNPSKDLLKSLNKCSTFPYELQGRVAEYNVEYSLECQNFVDILTKRQTTFDFKLDYDAQVLVHEQCGGGLNAIETLEKTRFNPYFKLAVSARVSSLGGNYDAVVIRHANDYQTDYVSLFRDIQQQMLGKRLLVCSDNAKILAYAKTYLKGTEVLSFGDYPDTQGVPFAIWIRYICPVDRRYRAVTASIADLFALASSTQLILPKLIRDGINGYSGFALLANELKNRPALLYSYLNK